MAYELISNINDIRIERNGAGTFGETRITYKYRTFYTCKAPHGNCQTASIACFNEILDIPKKDIRLIIQSIWKKALEGKRQILIDVNDKWNSTIESIFDNCDIVFKQSYESSNGSYMTMYLIKIDEITGYDEDNEDDDDDY